MSITSKQSGFAMMEALITALIIAIGISGVGVLLMRSIQGTQDNSQRSQAMWIVQDFVGRLRANSVAAKASAYAVSIDKAACANAPAVLCSNDDASCNSSDMATYDSWVTVCGFDSTVFDAPADFVVNPVLNSECTLTNSRNECVQYTVDLQWDTKLAKESAVAEERTNTNNYSMVVEVN